MVGDALAVGDGGVDALLDARADHLALGVGKYHHHVEHHLGHPIVLADRADRLVHEVDINPLHAEILDEAGEVCKRPAEAIEFMRDHHVVLRDVLAEPLVLLP